METFALYLLKSAFWLSGFAIIYFLFLRNERFFILKRFYLVIGIMVSVFFPFIPVHYQVEALAPVTAPVDFISSVSSISGALHTGNSEKLFDFRYILLMLYLSGVLFFTFRLIRQIKSIYNVIRKADISRLGPAKLIRTSEFSSPFTFLNFIFISPSVSEPDVEEIINHELVHVSQKHWFDLLVFELLRLLQWVNPFALIYAGFIRLNHEYIADEIALRRTSDPAIYRSALLNQIFNTQVISLSNSFNSSFNNNRFYMMKRIITSPYRKLKVLFVLPVFAIVFYAFATPEYHYAASENGTSIITGTSAIIDQTVKGIVLSKENKPLFGVIITVSGTSAGVSTDQNGYFAINGVPDGCTLVFTYSGYKKLNIDPDFSKEMTVIMVKDSEVIPPDVKIVPAPKNPPGQTTKPKPLIIIDGVESERGLANIDPNTISTISVLKDQSSTAVYGEKGKNGVIIVTLKKEVSLTQTAPGINQNAVRGTVFKEDGMPLKGVRVLSTGPKGDFETVSDVAGRFAIYNLPADYLLVFSHEGYKSQKINPDFAKEMHVVMLEDINYFKLQVNVAPDNTPDTVYVKVDLMPEYPGGDAALMQFIYENIQYPEEAKEKNIQGRILVKFIVTKDGNITNSSVLKPVDPLLDAEAIRVVNLTKGWKPGHKGGKPVDVWNFAGITFSLPRPMYSFYNEYLFSKTSMDELLKFLAENTSYPQEAKKSAETGKVFVVVKMVRGGTVKECKAFTDINEIGVPVLPEVVIVGYKPASQQSADISRTAAYMEHSLLKDECLRVVNKLSVNEVPDWKEKDLEFAFAFNFVLK
jgi:TonB family protein